MELASQGRRQEVMRLIPRVGENSRLESTVLIRFNNHFWGDSNRSMEQKRRKEPFLPLLAF